MKFLDLNGLNHFWTKIKSSFGTAIVKSSQNSNIPFVANHQIVNIDTAGSINVYDWFQKASKGGILEIVFAGARGSTIVCSTNNNSYIYRMPPNAYSGPVLNKIASLGTAYTTYICLIKMYDDKLVVTQFV